MTLPPDLRDPYIRWTNIQPLRLEPVAGYIPKNILPNKNAGPVGRKGRSLAEVWGLNKRPYAGK
jgi:hypothetical protein